MAPRKVRLVVDMIRNLSVDEAETRLKFAPRAAALPVLKLLQSAKANAVHNNKLDASTLFVKAITADGGPTLKRFRPRAMGRAATIRKRTTHISIVLSDERPAASVAALKKAAAKKPAAKKPAAKKAAVTA